MVGDGGLGAQGGAAPALKPTHAAAILSANGARIRFLNPTPVLSTLGAFAFSVPQRFRHAPFTTVAYPRRAEWWRGEDMPLQSRRRLHCTSPPQFARRLEGASS